MKSNTKELLESASKALNKCLKKVNGQKKKPGISLKLFVNLLLKGMNTGVEINVIILNIF